MKYIAILVLLTAPAFVLANETGIYGMGGQRTGTGTETITGSTIGSTESARRSTVSARPGLYGRPPVKINPLTGEDEVITETVEAIA